MNEILANIVMVMIYVTGFVASLAGLLWLFWWCIGRIIKMTGYWKLFYRALMIAGREAREKRRKE